MKWETPGEVGNGCVSGVCVLTLLQVHKYTIRGKKSGTAERFRVQVLAWQKDVPKISAPFNANWLGYRMDVSYYILLVRSDGKGEVSLLWLGIRLCLGWVSALERFLKGHRIKAQIYYSQQKHIYTHNTHKNIYMYRHEPILTVQFTNADTGLHNYLHLHLQWLLCLSDHFRFPLYDPRIQPFS